MLKKILIITNSILAHDGRVLRQIKFLRSMANLELTVAAVGRSPLTDNRIRYIELPSSAKNLFKKIKEGFQLKTKHFSTIDPFYLRHNVLSRLKNEVFDLIIVNDVDPLPVAFDLAQKKTRILLDAHEYAPLEFEENWLFRFFLQDYKDYLCRTYLPRLDAMVTVCDDIADAYAKNYGVSPQIITNAPFYEPLNPQPVVPDNIRLIHHGGYNSSRRLGLLLELMKRLDRRFHLTLMLVSPPTKAFINFCHQANQLERVKLIKPVSPEKIAQTINIYDIGIFMFHTKNFNYRYGLPNKLLESIQGRLAVVTWSTPGIAKFVEQYQCGVISQEYTVESMADTLNKLTVEDIMKLKEKSHLVAKQLCAEKNQEKFCNLVNNLL